MNVGITTSRTAADWVLDRAKTDAEALPHFFYKVVHGHAEWPTEVQWDSARMQRIEFEGEPIALYFVNRHGHEALTTIMRFEEQDGRVARVRSYGFCPDTVRAVGEALGVHVFTGLYRAPTPAPGERWPEPSGEHD